MKINNWKDSFHELQNSICGICYINLWNLALFYTEWGGALSATFIQNGLLLLSCLSDWTNFCWHFRCIIKVTFGQNKIRKICMGPPSRMTHRRLGNIVNIFSRLTKSWNGKVTAFFRKILISDHFLEIPEYLPNFEIETFLCLVCKPKF